MWLITPIGFFSVVQKPVDRKAGVLTIRARVRGDLDTLREKYLPSLEDSVGTDYRYRANAPQAETSAAVARMIADIDYSNFKNKVAKSQGRNRSDVYHDVWSVLNRLQTAPRFADD